MPIERKYLVFSYDEASEELKEKILEKYRYINVHDDFWSESVLDDWKEKLAEKGFKDAKISYSGFANQGDGASFTCKDIDIEKLLAWVCADEPSKTYYKLLTETYAKGDLYLIGFVERLISNYVHEKTTKFNLNVVYEGDDEKVQIILDAKAIKLREGVHQELVNLNREIYTDLKKEYEYLISDEQIAETLRCNEYLFDEDGHMD